jgi:hypothetical protein
MANNAKKIFIIHCVPKKTLPLGKLRPMTYKLYTYLPP